MMKKNEEEALFRGAPDSDILPIDAGELFDTIRFAGQQKFGLVSTTFILHCLFISDLLCKIESGRSFTSAMWTYVSPDLKISYVQSGSSLERLTSWHVSILRKTFEWVASMQSHDYISQALFRLCHKKPYGDIIGSLSSEECMKLIQEIDVYQKKENAKRNSIQRKLKKDEFFMAPPRNDSHSSPCLNEERPSRSSPFFSKLDEEEKIKDRSKFAPKEFSSSDGFDYVLDFRS